MIGSARIPASVGGQSRYRIWIVVDKLESNIVSGRGWLYIAMVAIAVGGPYLSSQSDRNGANWWDSMWAVEDGSGPPLVSINSAKRDGHAMASGTSSEWQSPSPVTQHPTLMPTVRPPEPPLPTLPEALRFDLSPEWVSHRWPQVWRRHDEMDLSSLRVTMLSGTRLTDLAGSLTYSFDKSQLLQRIELDGSCGDPSELIAIVTQRYGLQPMPAVGGYQYVARGTRNWIVSAMRIENAPVVRQSQPFERYQVSLELNHPSRGRQISERMRDKLELPESDIRRMNLDESKSGKSNKEAKSPSKSGVGAVKEKDPHRPLDALLRNSG